MIFKMICQKLISNSMGHNKSTSHVIKNYNWPYFVLTKYFNFSINVTLGDYKKSLIGKYSTYHRTQIHTNSRYFNNFSNAFVRKYALSHRII